MFSDKFLFGGNELSHVTLDSDLFPVSLLTLVLYCNGKGTRGNDKSRVRKVE